MAYKDPEVRRAKQRESYHKNRDIHLKKHKEYYVKNKDSCLQKAKEYKEKNKEYFQEYLRDYREKNREKNKEYQREYHTKNKKSLRAKAGQYRKKKRAIDPIFRLTDNLRGRFGIVISGRSKSKSVLSLLGCSVEQFKKHIEEQFTEGMNWENYGQMGHHIDHILDCRFFDLTKIEEQEICWNYRNMQPLWSKENIRKGSLPIPDNFEQLKEELRTRIQSGL